MGFAAKYKMHSLRKIAMASTPELGQARAGKVDSEVAVEDVMKQYEFMKLANAVQPGEKSFVWPEGRRPDIKYDQYDFDLPIIDLSPVLKLQSLRTEIEQLEADSGTRSGLEAEIKACEAAKSDIAKAIRAACEEYGFFQIINSGFLMEVVDQFRESCRQIFDLPFEEKVKIKETPIPGKPSLLGYTEITRNNAFTRMNPAHSWSEGFDVESPARMYPDRVKEIANILWPGEPENSTKGKQLCSSVEEYGKEASKVIYLLLDLIVSSLGIPEEAVDGLLGDRQEKQLSARLRGNNYPICERPELTFGINPHTDTDVITLLHQDVIGGLQILIKDGTWHGVEPKRGAFIINCGDFLQAWTNGRFLSAEHRVVANDKTRRISIAYFAVSDMNYVVSPRPECVDAEHPVRYKPFTALQYFKELLTLGAATERGELLEKAFGIKH
ncbi:unnamed protein product [Calypogeia fissa]